MKINSICIVGVDGTGKSTIVKLISKMFKDDFAIIQYMGVKNWETKIMKAFYYDKKNMPKALRYIGIVYEFYHRVYKYRNSKKIVIFDRYVNELYIGIEAGDSLVKKISKAIYKNLFEKFFYIPTVTFYLTCDIEISIERKDDIITDADVRLLNENKIKMDKYYKNRNDVNVIDTSHISIDEVISIIQKHLTQKEHFRIFMRNDLVNI